MNNLNYSILCIFYIKRICILYILHNNKNMKNFYWGVEIPYRTNQVWKPNERINKRGSYKKDHGH